MSYKFAGKTDPGSVRDFNEDWVFVGQYAHGRVLAVLADGMGGYKGGAIASQLCSETLIHQLEKSGLADKAKHKTFDPESQLQQSAHLANCAVYDARNKDEELARMGTTLVAVLVDDSRFSVIHAGDSRCYRISCATADVRLDQLTRDDSVVQQMLDDGAIKPAEAHRVPFKNVLTKAVGVESELVFSVASYPFNDNESLMLCSDGLYNSLSEETIAELLARSLSLDEKIDLLISECINRGASDNVSLIIVEKS